MARGGRRAPTETFDVDTGQATLLRDVGSRNAWTLLLDGVESSYVDLDNPQLLVFEYVRWIGDVLDCLAPSGAPLDTLHLGGGALTLPRYLSATRNGSRQLVVEIDGALVVLMRRKLPWSKDNLLKVRIADARSVIDNQSASTFDVVVRDAFRDAVVPDALRTVDCARRVKTVLRKGGTYLLNVADRTPFSATGVEIAALLEVFADVLVVSEPGVLRGRRHGNLVLIASDEALPVELIARRVADGGVQGRVRARSDAVAMARGRKALYDSDLAGRT